MSKEEKVYREDYFIYKGVAYGIGTKVIFTDEYFDKHGQNSPARGKPFVFFAGYTNGWKRFSWYSGEQFDSRKPFAFYRDLKVFDTNDIKEIVEPVYAEIIPTWARALDNATTGRVQADTFGGWVLYLLAMGVGTIFKDRLTVWIAATIIFVNWLIKQYRD